MDLHDQSNVGNIVQSIFSTCDIDNIDLVPVSKLIEFIRPYLLQDLEALENLQLLLDPFNTEALITSEQFCEVMTNWCQTLASPTEGETENSEFNKTPCNPASIDMLDLPYTHSTPRASLGDKLALRCKDLLNLSNVSGYSLSTSRVEECEPDKTILEEENKMLKQQLSKTSHELLMIKQQLAASEDINEQLQQDLGKANRILQQEQQANEHLTKDIKYSEDLRDELSYCKKHIGQLKSKLEQSQKEVLFTQKLNNELEEEKCKLEKKAEASSKYREQMENELIGAKNEVNSKAVQLQEQNEMFSALQRDFARQKDIIDQLMEENNRLNQHKVTLARTVESKSFDQEEKFTILGNSEESFELELDPELIKTNGNSADQAHKSLYTEICKTRPLADSSYSELIMQGDKLELKTLLEADNCRFTLRGIEQELKKTENALEVKSNQCDALEKRLAEVQAKLIESETSLKNHNQALQMMFHDLGDAVLDSSLQAQIVQLQKELDINNTQFSLKRLARIFVDEYGRLQGKALVAQLEVEAQTENRRPASKASKKVASYSKQQMVIDKLKEKNEYLESLLQISAATKASKGDALKNIEVQIVEKQGTWEELEARCGQLREDVRAAEEKLKITEEQLETLKRRVEETEAEDIFDVPSLDVRVFADELVGQLDWIESSPRSREKLGRDKLEQMVRALTLQLMAHCSTITERIEKETKKYRSEYEGLLDLITDISHRLRDHVCIGTSEPIIPVHVLLEEVKQRVKMLVQNAGQVSVLISEHRIKWCWDLMISHMAMLQQDNEGLRVLSRIASQSDQTDVNKILSAPATSVGKDKNRRSYFGYSLKATFLFVIILVVVMALIIAINQTCRMIVDDAQYCPFDGAVERINQGLPPL
ncbi:hypothetical protein HUJ04_002095 [Dendroctonus ponderosae]|nr:hypothetical protein HUJ04_002095 [Dendroctonus ponderosae]